MNLWAVFPQSLLHIDGILYLPYAAIIVYFYVTYLVFKAPNQRIQLIIFLLATLVASLTMFYSMGPRIGTITPPLLLLLVMFMPLSLLISHIRTKDSQSLKVWGAATIAGWLHSLSWAVWLFALARS